MKRKVPPIPSYTSALALSSRDQAQGHPVQLADLLIRDKDGAALIAGSVATWWRRVADGTLPPPIRIGGMSRWRLSEVEAVIEKAAAKRGQG